MDSQTELLHLIAQRSWYGESIGKWSTMPGLHIGTKEVLFSPDGPRLVGSLLGTQVGEITPPVVGVAGDGVAGSAMAVMAAIRIQLFENRPIVPLLIREAPPLFRNKRLVEGASSLPTGAAIAVVDDTLDTGRTLQRVIDILRLERFWVIAAIVLVARTEISLDNLRKQRIHARALFMESDIEAHLSSKRRVAND